MIKKKFLKYLFLLVLMCFLCSIVYASQFTIYEEESKEEMGILASGKIVSLFIFDDTDYSTRETGDYVRFYANYSNGSSGDIAECKISFDLGSGYWCCK